MRIAIIVEAIPPYCGGGEQVAWLHAVELAKRHEVTVVTFGDTTADKRREGVQVRYVPRTPRILTDYSMPAHRSLLNRCIDEINPDVIHCHMPNVLSACLTKKGRFMVSTIHDGVPESEMRKLRSISVSKWLKFKALRYLNIRKSDAVTCVSAPNLAEMRALYPSQAHKFSLIENPIYDGYFAPVVDRDDGFVLNFGRQIALKMGVLLEVAREMPTTRFVFVGTGEMVRDHGIANAEFVGFSSEVISYIDRASICVFPSKSENFPLVGLEAMARGKPVIATRRGFGEYIQHRRNGFLLASSEPAAVREAIREVLLNARLRRELGRAARETAMKYRPAAIVAGYEALYSQELSKAGVGRLGANP